ncbi:MAG TPA: tetratricopeptide repeat protein [Bryobacteraceae bacterium]|nr:tetratricopeptide repeat protein [Bryobacteraceae bacterium]
MPEVPRPVFLSGKVMLDDGTAPAEPVVLERVCNGIARPEGFTDSKGRFSFELGRNSAMMADASVGSARDPFGDPNMGFGGGRMSSGRGGALGGSDPRLLGCELRAALAGFRSDVVNLSQRRSLDNPDVGTIILHRIGNVEGTTISATSLSAPKEARKAYEKGIDAMRKSKWENAQKQFEKAVAEHPNYAAAWYELGVAHQQQQRPEEARKAFAQALDADPKYVKPYLNLALLASSEKKWDEVAKNTDTLIRLNPIDFPQAYVWNSIANLNLHNPDAAEKSAREALKITPGVPKLRHILGLALANKGDYAGAAQEVSAYVQAAPQASDVELARKQLVEIQQRAGAPQK